MVAEVAFLHPVMLWGLAVASAPVLIHLLLRPRPRRAHFPAITLLRAALVSGQRANKLRNLILLLMRVLLLTLVAVLLAAPTCTPTTSDWTDHQPVAAAIVIDDSISMTYQPDAASSLYSLALAQARELIDRSAGWPKESMLTILGAGMSGPTADWTNDRNALNQMLDSIATQAPHADPLDSVLQTASEMLRDTKLPSRRLVVLTDGAAHAWEATTPATLAGIDNLTVRIVPATEERRTNLAILSATAPERLHPAAAPVPIRVKLAATEVDSECWLVVLDGTETLLRAGSYTLDANQPREILLELPAQAPGPHAFTIQLDPTDRMTFDQHRYVAFQTAHTPQVWLISSSDEDLSALILRNLLAPEILAPEQQLVTLKILAPDTVEAAFNRMHRDITQPELAMVILLSNTDLPAVARQSLLQHVEQGGLLLLVPSSATPDTDWPGIRTLLTATQPEITDLDTLSALRWETTSAYNGHADLSELTRSAVRRRVLLRDLFKEVSIEASYMDGTAAIVSKPIGAGRLLLLTTAPAPSWSDLGIRAAGLISWLHLLIDEALGPPGAIGVFAVGEQSRRCFADLPDGGLASVRLHTQSDSPPVWRRLAPDIQRQSWPTDQAGIYEVAPSTDKSQSGR
ncbi:MAG: VWA domain-containing protein [Planctomycetota bacterium]